MERPLTNHPFRQSEGLHSKENDDSQDLNEHIQKFIEELEKGTSPQEAARHAADFRNTKSNYIKERKRHEDFWKQRQ